MRPAPTLVAIFVVAGLAVTPAQQSQQAQPPPPPPQDQRPAATFRVGVDYVEIDASVTDERGNFVGTLTAGDFELLEDGRAQEISVFSKVQVPQEDDDRPLFRTAALRPDVTSNERPFDGRLYMIVLDDLHVDARRTSLVRSMARQFIQRHLGANDLAAVIHVGRAGANQEFTGDKFLLLRSVDAFSGQKLRSPTLNKLDDYRGKMDDPELRTKPAMDTEEPVRIAWAETTMQTLTTMAQYVSRLQGRRKAFLFFSEGVDYDLQNPMTETFSGIVMGSESSRITSAMRNVFVDATRANVSIYPIDPRGLATGLEEMVGLGGLPVPIEGDENVFGADRVLEGLRVELDGSLDVLRTLASETGGRAIVNTNDIVGPFRRIVEDSSNYYLLGYYPTNRSRNGAFRTVTVRVKRPGVQVRARRGYFAPKAAADETAPDRLKSVLASPVPTSGLSMRATTLALQGRDGNARVQLILEIPPGQLGFDPVEGVFRNEMEIGYEAAESTGARRLNGTQTATFKLQPSTLGQVEQHGLSVTTEFALPPGRYQLRVATLERREGRAGSVFADVEVPAYAREPFAMTDLVLASPRYALGFSLASGSEALSQVLPAPPTTRRTFARSDPLAVYTEIYDNDKRPHVVDLAVRLQTEDGREVFTSLDQRESRQLARGGNGHGYLVWVPLTRLNAGRYVLSVEARSRLEGRVVVKETTIVVTD